MHIITKGKLVEFWQQNPDSENPLRIWYQLCKKSDFESFARLKQTFGSVDKVGRFTVFNIGGNKYRLVAVVHYRFKKIYIRHVLTHANYDQDHWKNE